MAFYLTNMSRRRIIASQPNEITREGSIVSFGTNISRPMQVTCTLSPVQSGSGDPYPPGGGKNILPTIIDTIKSINTGGAWTGNAYAYNGVTYTINTDGAGNVIGISTSGTASADSALDLVSQLVLTVPCVINGCPSGGSTTTYRIFATNIGSDTGSGVSKTQSGETTTTIRINIKSGTNASGLTFKPMIRLASVTDGTFAPYSNIRPITGWTGCDVTGAGVNLCNPSVGRNEGKLRGDDGTESSTSSSGYTAPMDGFLPNTAYTISGQIQTANGAGRIYFLDSDGNWISRTTSFGLSEMPYTFTTPANCRFIEIQYNNAYTALTGVQVEKGGSASTYTAYTGTTIPITWQTEAGTVYGGTATLNRDGSVTVVSNMVHYEFDGSEDESWIAVGLGTSSQRFNIVADTGIKQDGTISNYLKLVLSSSEPFGGMRIIESSNTIMVTDSGNKFASKNAFKAYLAENPLTVVSPLATPVTYTLSASSLNSLLGVNNVWADAGDVSVKAWGF